MSAPQLMMTNTMHLRTESRFCANDSLLFIDLKSIGSIPWTRWLKSKSLFVCYTRLCNSKVFVTPVVESSLNKFEILKFLVPKSIKLAEMLHLKIDKIWKLNLQTSIDRTF